MRYYLSRCQTSGHHAVLAGLEPENWSFSEKPIIFKTKEEAKEAIAKLKPDDVLREPSIFSFEGNLWLCICPVTGQYNYETI